MYHNVSVDLSGFLFLLLGKIEHSSTKSKMVYEGASTSWHGMTQNANNEEGV